MAKLSIGGQAHETRPDQLDGRHVKGRPEIGRYRIQIDGRHVKGRAEIGRYRMSKLACVTRKKEDTGLAPTGVTACT